MGNTHLENNELDKAITSYKEALKIKEDEGARFKLELAVVKKKNEAKKAKKQHDALKEKMKEKSDAKKDKKKKDDEE